MFKVQLTDGQTVRVHIGHRVESNITCDMHPSLATGYSTESAEVLPSETISYEGSLSIENLVLNKQSQQINWILVS